MYMRVKVLHPKSKLRRLIQDLILLLLISWLFQSNRHQSPLSVAFCFLGAVS